MTEGVIIAIITGICSLIGVVITVHTGNKKTTATVKEQTELTLYRIVQLEKKQDKHNTLIERMYAVEEKVDILVERQKTANHRIEDLEEYHKPKNNPPVN